MRNKEHDLQVACVSWFRMAYPRITIFAIPNGGQRNVIIAAKLKLEGVLAGVPDIFVAQPNERYAGLFIEMKVRPNGPSESQVSVMRSLERAGYLTQVCYSFEEFRVIIEEYMT